MILICDDDTTVRTSLTLVLKRAGYEVATAANQQEAIDFVRHTCPQLILMDMNYSNTTSRAYVPVLSILSRNRGTTWLC